VAQGLVSPFYQNTLAGFWQFATGTTFFGTVTGNWQWKWDSAVGDWFAILLQTANWLIILAAFAGAVWLARRRWKLAFWLVGITLLFQLLALQYSYEGLAAIGQFSTYFREYFLPSFITLIILAAWGIDGFLRGANAIAARAGIASARVARAAPAVLVIAALGVSAQDLVARRSTALNERSAQLQAQWEIVKKYPPEDGAALVSHWGDLTPLWYYQYADGWRRDLLTIHPPNDDLVNAWMATGKPLYLAGPLLDWAPGIAKKYQLTPWGPLVRVTPNAFLPPSPLVHSVDWTFEDDHPALRALGYDVSGESARVGDTIDVAIYWQVLDNISIDDYVVYLSLADSSGATPAQPFPPVVNWLPGKKLAAGQRALATYRFAIPWGTKPDTYALRLAVYSIPRARNLNDVQVTRIKVDRALRYPDDVAAQNSVRADFGHQITFLGWDGNIKQVATGDTPTLQLLWKSTAALSDEMRASLSLENANGARVVSDEAISKNYPPPTWRAGEIVRESRTVTFPADLPDGDYAVVLRVRLASKPAALGVYDGWFPRGDSVTIGQARVVGRSHSYAIPAIPNPQPANFGNHISLLGYALDSSNPHPGESLRIKLHWQSLGLTNESYQVFVHVLDAKSRVVAQEDRIPGGGALPTTGWLPREVVTDAYELALPADLLAGRYQIEIGFYNGVTGQRLSVLDSNGRPVADHVILETAIQVSK
ncbi:MAG: hypothetical protein KGJ80_01845, partial [Chloroflexota bacterium]|nr:hypothetical protein [Chloroflexota bacterium]